MNGASDESDAAAGNRASSNDDITLCENTLYARDPQYDDGGSHGVFIFLCFIRPLNISYCINHAFNSGKNNTVNRLMLNVCVTHCLFLLPFGDKRVQYWFLIFLVGCRVIDTFSAGQDLLLGLQQT